MSEKIVKDNPQDNYETLCNFCRYENGRAKFLETIDGRNIDVYDYCRRKCAEKCHMEFPEKDDGTMMEQFWECCDVVDCPIYLLYISAVQAAELREYLRKYEEFDCEEDKNGKI